MRDVRRRSFLFLLFMSRRGGGGGCQRAALALSLVRLVAAEDAAHALDVLAQALATVHVLYVLWVHGWGGTGRRHGAVVVGVSPRRDAVGGGIMGVCEVFKMRWWW